MSGADGMTALRDRRSGPGTFRARTGAAWAAFRREEAQLRALADRGRTDPPAREEMVRLCAEALSPAFLHPSFEMGRPGPGRYDLVLVPEGDRTRLFQMTYFAERAPEDLRARWNIQVGRARATGYALRLWGREVTAGDFRVWMEPLPGDGLSLTLFCDREPPPAPDRDRMVWLASVLVDQVLGEIAAMRYVLALDVVTEPPEGEGFPLPELPQRIAAMDPEGWAVSDDPEAACDSYVGYRGRPSEAADRPSAGTCTPAPPAACP